MKKKTIAILMAAMLVCGGAIGATVAWLTDSTDTIVNTFTYGNVDITLTETKPDNYTAKMIPGSVIEKDPKVTVEAESEPCYVFVKITPSTDPAYSTYFGEFTSDDVNTDNWTALTGVPNVYYKDVDPNSGAPLSQDEVYYILKGTTNPNGEVLVDENVSKADMDALDEDTGYLPKLTFKAFAIQKANVGSVAEAWDKVKPAESQTTP
ncbi:MAG: SipW-dependent-type signal peptide-containing protein [Lachnospiraceae bacterium]|nr:SipW-dependent-type signal peptide-containing protein [Lachnospiraceae bacterium]